MMSTIPSAVSARRGQTLIEFTLILPFLIALGLAVIEFGNIIYNYLVLTHLTREAANLVSREPGVRGSAPWTARVNTDLNSVINTSSSVIRTANLPDWLLTYSMIRYDTAKIGGCGLLNNGAPDFYVVERNFTDPGWVDPT